jgi:glucan phosphoethanolaminetransferase (alkaline phosphatase superfamily)
MKKYFRRVLVPLYLGAVMISLLILIKPGAAIFFIKQNMNRELIVKDAGMAYRYRLDVNPHFIRIGGIQVYENRKLLTLTSSDIVANAGKSAYAISISSQGTTYIYFSASNNSDPVTNGRNYTIYLPLTFISQPMGILYVILLLPLAVRLAIFALTQQPQRRLIASSLGGILLVFDRFFDYSLPSIPAEIRSLWQEKVKGFIWKRLWSIVVLVAFLYVFMEWLFFVTMPSFMSMTSFINKVEILLFSGLAFSLICLLAVVVFIFLDIIVVIAYDHRITHYLEFAIPAIVLSCLALLLVDNFTYTIFKFGIITSSGVVRGLYGLFFIFCSVYFYVKILNFSGLRTGTPPKKNALNQLFFLSLGLLAISFGWAMARLDFSVFTSNTKAKTQQASSLPNIILLGSDGLSADHLSVYGYGRDTTPQLRELAQTSLVAENAFPNASKTTGSIVSLITSKLPTETRVLFPPNILTGIDVYQHLPGILKNEGYETVEFGEPYYVDADNYNLQNAFDMVNNRSEDENSLSAVGRKLGYDNAVYFLNKIYARISDRIQHILFVREMPDPYKIVTHPIQSISDEQKINETLDLLDNTKKPLFVHIHLLGTHGPVYEPPINVFSKDEQQYEEYMADFYDDTILAFDRYVGQVIDHLKKNGQFNNTILIVYTDHNYKYETTERIPLIFHFPFDEYAGRIKSNVENIDIAPTVVDYLGIPVPEWMKGESLLHGELDRHRLIFGTMLSGEVFNENNNAQLDPSLLKPPFYQFSYIDLIDCQRWYILNLVDNVWSWGDVTGYISPCDLNSLYSFEEIKQAAIDQLTRDGFDTSSIR